MATKPKFPLPMKKETPAEQRADKRRGIKEDSKKDRMHDAMKKSGRKC